MVKLFNCMVTPKYRLRAIVNCSLVYVQYHIFIRTEKHSIYKMTRSEAVVLRGGV
jgi:hypothetical protein